MTWQEEFETLYVEKLHMEGRQGDYMDLDREGIESLKSFIQKTREDVVRETLEEIHALLHNGK
jgi:hypothetical protein